jgi:hypothetical protein
MIAIEQSLKAEVDAVSSLLVVVAPSCGDLARRSKKWISSESTTFTSPDVKLVSTLLTVVTQAVRRFDCVTIAMTTGGGDASRLTSARDVDQVRSR